MDGVAQAPSATALLQQTADALGAMAREHKRAAAYHRRQAQQVRQRLAALEANCRQLGIRLVVTPSNGHSPEGDTDHA